MLPVTMQGQQSADKVVESLVEAWGQLDQQQGSSDAMAERAKDLRYAYGLLKTGRLLVQKRTADALTKALERAIAAENMHLMKAI